MRIVLKAAASLDGYLDDTRVLRRVYSGPADRRAVDTLRSEFDAILIGAQTLRADDPRLLIRDPALIEARVSAGRQRHPRRVVLTRGGELPNDAKLFTDSNEKPLIVCPASVAATLESLLGSKAQLLPIADEKLSVDASAAAGEITFALEALGITSLLVEGGAEIIGLFSRHPGARELRLAIAPIVLGETGRANVFRALEGVELSLQSVAQLDSLSVMQLRITS